MSDETTTGYNEEWIEEYRTLEFIRQSGATNMFGAAPYLAEACDITTRQATTILMSWMQNYDELVEAGVC